MISTHVWVGFLLFLSLSLLLFPKNFFRSTEFRLTQGEKYTEAQNKGRKETVPNK